MDINDFMVEIYFYSFLKGGFSRHGISLQSCSAAGELVMMKKGRQ